jgi:hypothetical protein
VRAYGGPQFQVTQQVMSRFAEAIQQSGVDVVPRVLIGGGQTGSGSTQGNGNLMEGLMALLLAERMGEPVRDAVERSPEVERLRNQIRDSIALDEPRDVPVLAPVVEPNGTGRS